MDNELFSARVRDTAVLCERTSVPKFLGFLTPLEAAEAEKILKNGRVRYSFFGGYEGAERTFLACLPDWCDAAVFPFAPVTASFHSAFTLTHRDFLGALMALGLSRSSIGDILIESGRAVFFVKNEILSFVLSQVDKVGRVGVELAEGYNEPLPKAGVLIEASGVVASERLDCVVALLCGVSRSRAAELIEDGFVSVNSLCAEKTSRTVEPLDWITVRGKGKFRINEMAGRSKKGRIILKYSKFDSVK